MLGMFIKTSCVYSDWIPGGIQRSEINIKQIKRTTEGQQRKKIWKENKNKEGKKRKKSKINK